MIVRPPRPSAPKIWTDNPAAALDYELAQEKAATLGRLGRGLEHALASLAAFDAQRDEPSGEATDKRGELVMAAGHALWLFVVQREALGLRDTRQVMRDYRVPAEVQGRMGIMPARRAGGRR
jgi:uncharacterized protein DUF6665